MAAFEVEIKPLLCKGCGICVQVCSQGCLEITESFNQSGYYYPEPVAIENCNGCAACAKLCPDFAVILYKLKKAS